MKYILQLLLISVCLISCSELDQEPRSSVGSSAVFNSESGLNLYSRSFYEVLPSTSDIIRGDGMSDFLARKDIPNFFRPGAYGPRQSTGWTWGQLRNINYFIENNRSQNVPVEVRNHYQGLAKFFRAWFYFDKVKRFGDVPWINKAMDVNDPDLFNGRDSRVLVMDSILNDLDYAIQHISTTQDASRSLITKYVAYAFKSRVALFEATFRKYHTSHNLTETAPGLFRQAADAAHSVMEEGGFALYQDGETPYKDLFISKSPNGSEVILLNLFDGELGILHDANWYFTSASYGDRLSFTRSFIHTYLNIDGTPFTDNHGFETMLFHEEVANRDKRLDQTIRTPGYSRVVGGNVMEVAPVFSFTYTGYQPIKWVLDDSFYDNGTRNENCIPIIRYAEVLLNYAEAKAELQEMTNDDWEKTVAALRRRAGIQQNISALPTQIDSYLQAEFFPQISDPVLLEVRRERGIELALEGFRFHDLVRWRRGELIEKPWNGMYVPQLNDAIDLNQDGNPDVLFFQNTNPGNIAGVINLNVSERVNNNVNPMRLSNGNSGEIIWMENMPRVWEDKFYLYPIPEADRLMNPAIGQNPDWN